MSNLKLEFNYSTIQSERGYTRGRGARVKAKGVTRVGKG
jgi:hypothetical protein